MIGIDWGTSSFRAYRLGLDGTVRDRRNSSDGILGVAAGGFPNKLRELVGDWLREGESRVLLSGMVGSRQGWREAPYLSCPAGLTEVAGALLPVDLPGAQAFIVPGLIAEAPNLVEVIRGEETQILGALSEMGPQALACLPGTHAKWVRIANGRVAAFTTAMTGEVFAALKSHTILGRLMQGDAPDEAAFDAGLARSAAAGGLLHHIFGARTLVLAGHLGGSAAPSYLSGILIGHDVRAALAIHGRHETVHLIGEPGLCALYGRALTACGAAHRSASADAARLGLARIGELAPWR